MPGLTFSAAVRTNLLLIAASATAALAGAIAAPVAIYSAFVLVCANLIGGAGCYALECNRRRPPAGPTRAACSRAPAERGPERRCERGPCAPAREPRSLPDECTFGTGTDQDLPQRRAGAERRRPRGRARRLLRAARSPPGRGDDPHRHHHLAGQQDRRGKARLSLRHPPRAPGPPRPHPPPAAGNQPPKFPAPPHH